VSDVFGDLQEWGEVLTALDRLTEEGRLDEHQHELARLVRYRDNWRLQEAALHCALKVGCSCDLLLADTLNALVSRETPLTLRVTAAQATGHLLSCYDYNDRSPFDVQRAFQTLEQVAAQHQPPILADALREALDKARPAIERRGL
jgi:hypothetical protein